MTYDQLLPVYRQATGLPGQDAAFNQWVQGVIDATGAGSVEAIPDGFFQTPQGQQYVQRTTVQAPAATTTATTTPSTPAVGGTVSLAEALAELRLDADFAALPANWQTEIAQIAIAQGLEAAGAEMARRASAPDQDPTFADARASLTRWAGKAAQESTNTGSDALTTPIEQDLLDQVLPGLYDDIEGDAERRKLVATLTGQATDDYDTARNALSEEENQRRLLEEYEMADTTSTRLSDSAGTSADDQLAALQASIAAMQENLSGDLAAQAAALQQQIASLSGSLNQLSADQISAFGQQIDANQRNLERSIASQQQNLTNEVAALRGATDANAVARRAALQAEIDGLTAAQAPMAQARLDSANALTTAVNLGLESTNDALTAQRARQGYLGSSSFSDAALARAAIGARQQGAQAMGSAREMNAADTRSIQARGATEGRGIEDDYANTLMGLSGREATGGRSLADILAQGTERVANDWAGGLSTISNNNSTGLFGIRNAGANQSYQDRVAGSNDLQALLDALAKGSGVIGSQKATQQQDARDGGTMARQGYFDNAYTRGQGAILSRPGLSTNLVGTLTGLENYGNSGTNRALGTLGWWATGGQQAPTLGSVPAVVDNSGNDIAGLGAGLLGSALNVGNSAGWWKKNKLGEDVTNSANDD